MKTSGEILQVVVVDDEEMVLKSIETFLKLETDYRIHSFILPQQALEFIGGNAVDLVISDYLMPEMDGITFLSKVREIKPEIPRIILTGYADKENAVKAINEVGLYQYIEKPWENDDLLIIVRNGIEKRRMQKKLEEKMDEIDKAHKELKEMHNKILKAFV